METAMKNKKRFFKDKKVKYLATISISAFLLIVLAMWYNTAEMRIKGVTDENLEDQFSEAMEMLDAYSGKEAIEDVQPKDFGKAFRLRRRYIDREPVYYLENISKFYINKVVVVIDEGDVIRTVMIDEFLAPGAKTGDFEADIPRGEALTDSFRVKEGRFTDTFNVYNYEWVNENKRILKYARVEEFDPMARYILPKMQLQTVDKGQLVNMTSYIDNITDYKIHYYRFTFYDAGADEVKAIVFNDPIDAQGVSEKLETNMPAGETMDNVRPRFSLMAIEDEKGIHELLYDFSYGKVIEFSTQQGE